MSGIVTTTLTSLFGAPPSVFPGWQNPSPSAYRFTLPSQAWWQTYLGGGAFKNFANLIANLVMQLIAWVLHLAILIASQFSDPSWLIDPISTRIGTIFRLGYSAPSPGRLVRYVSASLFALKGCLSEEFARGGDASAEGFSNIRRFACAWWIAIGVQHSADRAGFSWEKHDNHSAVSANHRAARQRVAALVIV